MSIEDDVYERHRQDLIDEERDNILDSIAIEDFNSPFENLDEIDTIIVWEIYKRIYASPRL